jgi:hypothetical protein
VKDPESLKKLHQHKQPGNEITTAPTSEEDKLVDGIPVEERAWPAEMPSEEKKQSNELEPVEKHVPADELELHAAQPAEILKPPVEEAKAAVGSPPVGRVKLSEVKADAPRSAEELTPSKDARVEGNMAEPAVVPPSSEVDALVEEAPLKMWKHDEEMSQSKRWEDASQKVKDTTRSIEGRSDDGSKAVEEQKAADQATSGFGTYTQMSGSDAPLTDDGYEFVVALNSTTEMNNFKTRIIESLGSGPEASADLADKLLKAPWSLQELAIEG